MKLELEKRPTQVFLGVLLLLALAINLYFWNRPGAPSRYRDHVTPTSRPRPEPATPTRQTEATESPAVDRAAAQVAEVRRQNEAAQAAEARKQYLARYLNSGIQRKAGMRLVAVVAASADGKIERNLVQALSSRLQTNGVELVGTFFKPELVSDGLTDGLFSESTLLRQKLEIDKSLDGLILARESVEYVSNPSLENAITAKLAVEVAAQALDGSGASKSWTLTASGAGFDRNAARAMAEERILKQIENDKKMSLGSIFTAP